MVTAEEKQLILHYRAAQRSAELVAFDAVALGCERISGIEGAVPHKLKQVAMNIIRARFRDQADRTGRFHTGLDARRAGLHLELLQRIGKRHGHVSVVVRIVVISTIQSVIQARI